MLFDKGYDGECSWLPLFPASGSLLLGGPGAASDRASRVQGVLHLFVIVRVIDAQTRPFWLVKFEGCYDVGAVDGLFLTDFFILPVE